MENSARGTDQEGPNGIYCARLSARMFAPFFSAAAYRPARRGAWRLRTEPFDYRCAHHSGARVPRDGEWYSRPWVALVGDLELRCPVSDTDLQAPIRAHARISWWPAHATFTWIDGGVGFQKLPARRKEDSAIGWISGAYGDTVFTAEVRAQYHRAFLTEPTPCPAKPDQATEPSPVAVDPKAPIPDTEVKQEESEHSHSSEGTESDYRNDWWSDWRSHGREDTEGENDCGERLSKSRADLGRCTGGDAATGKGYPCHGNGPCRGLPYATAYSGH